MIKTFHPYQIVSPSPWPAVTSLVLLRAASSVVSSLHSSSLFNYSFFLALSVILISSYQWWRDIVRESSFQGEHSPMVVSLLKSRIAMFILSEVLFFVRFFWAFFHSSISPSVELGGVWPPAGIEAFNPIGIPLLNSVILLSSGGSITWAHHSIINLKLSDSIIGIVITIRLGIYFTILQAIEYIEAPFSFSDSCYGRTFFLATGFHGIHVILGTTFLAVNTIRIVISHNSSNHIVGMDLGAWYWHFVDLVWLFLFISIYWWGC